MADQQKRKIKGNKGEERRGKCLLNIHDDLHVLFILFSFLRKKKQFHKRKIDSDENKCKRRNFLGEVCSFMTSIGRWENF